MSIRKKIFIILLIIIIVILSAYFISPFVVKNIVEKNALEILESRGIYNKSINVIDEENYNALSYALIYAYLDDEIKPGDNYEIIDSDIEAIINFDPFYVLTGTIGLECGFRIEYKGKIYENGKQSSWIPVNCEIRWDGLKVAYWDRI